MNFPRYTLLLLLSCGTIANAHEKEVAPVEQFDQVIPLAIRLLETNQIDKFIDVLLPPKKVEQLTKRIPRKRLPQLLFSKNERLQLITDLKKARTMKPENSDNGKRKSYTIKTTKGKLTVTSKLEFIKIGKHWRID